MSASVFPGSLRYDPSLILLPAICSSVYLTSCGEWILVSFINLELTSVLLFPLYIHSNHCPDSTDTIFLHFSYLALLFKFIATFLIQDLTISPMDHWTPYLSLNSAVSLASFSYPPPYNHSGLSKWKSKYISSLFKSFSGSLMSKYIDLRVSYMTLQNLACPNFISVSHHLINSCYRTAHFKSQILICIECPLLSSLSWEYLLIFLRLKSLLLYKVFHDHLP